MDDFGRLDTEHYRAEVAKLKRSLGGPILGPLIARSLVVAVYAHCISPLFGPKHTSLVASDMSAFGGKADIDYARGSTLGKGKVVGAITTGSTL